MEKKTEKRSIHRKQIHKPISFEIGTRECGRFGNVLEKGVGVDISREGIGLITKRPLEEGDVLKLHFPVAAANTSIPVFTEVMWATTARGKFRVGLRFLA